MFTKYRSFLTKDQPEIYPLKGKGLSKSVVNHCKSHFTCVKHALQCFTYILDIPDSLQSDSFKIPKLYDNFQLKSDILVLYKCKLHFTSVKHCKSCFTCVKCHSHCALQNVFFWIRAMAK